MKKIIFFVSLLLCFLLLSSSYAQIPHLINYQGKLTDKDGDPVADGNYSVTFRIYDAESGGALLWEETQSILVQKGIFFCLLGGVTNLDLVFDKPYWLAIKVGSDSEMTPRQQIASAGYAMRAERAGVADLAENANVAESISAENILGVLSIVSGGTGNSTGWSFKLGSFTHTSGATQSIAGIGFKPRLVVFFVSGAGDRSSTNSYGLDDGGNAMCVYGLRDSGGHYQTYSDTSYSIKLSSHDQNQFDIARISSLDTDGFTLTWSLDQLSATDTIIYLAFE